MKISGYFGFFRVGFGFSVEYDFTRVEGNFQTLMSNAPDAKPPSKVEVKSRILQGFYVTIPKVGGRSDVWKHFELVKDPQSGKFLPWIWAEHYFTRSNFFI